MSNKQRRRILVDRAVQGALARRMVLHWVCFLLIASVFTLLLQVLASPFQPLSSHFSNAWRTQGTSLLVAALLLPAFVVDTLQLSSRFAGPISRFRREMREIAAGKPATELRFRQGDFWHELAADFNAMMARVGAIKQGDSGRSKHRDSDLDETMVGATTESY